MLRGRSDEQGSKYRLELGTDGWAAASAAEEVKVKSGGRLLILRASEGPVSD